MKEDTLVSFQYLAITINEYVDVDFGKWFPNAEFEGRLERQVSFNIPINNPLLKAKETICQERNIQMIAEPDQIYVIETEAKTPQAPYGDTFIAKSRVCITRAGPSRCRLVMSIGMIWLKSPLVKSIIKDATFKGFARYTVVFLSELKEILKSMQKAKREKESVIIASEHDLELFVDVIKNEKDKHDQSRGILDSLKGTIEIGLEFFSDIMHGFLIGPIRTFIFRYPFAFFIPLLLFSLYISAWTTNFVWQRLVLGPQYNANCSLNFQIRRPHSQLNEAMLEWTSPSYRHVFQDLKESERDIGLLHCEMMELFRHISELDRHVAAAKYITWIADRLADCYQKNHNNNCFELEQSWSENLLDFINEDFEQ